MKVVFAEVNGVRTRYLTAGQGPALLLIHPIGHSADVFVRNVDGLGGAFTVVAPDLPGHGFSDPIDFAGRAPQIGTLAHYLDLMSALGHDRFAVAGSSYGGLIAALLCEASPQRVFGLVIVGSGSVFHETDQQRTTLKGTRDNVAAGMRDPSVENCRQRIANICFSPGSVPEEILLSRATMLALPDRLPNFVATLDALADSDAADRVLDRLEELRTPTLVITGREDIRAHLDRHELGVARMPDARLSVFDACGHLPFLEHAERFNAEVTAFLQQRLATKGEAGRF